MNSPKIWHIELDSVLKDWSKKSEKKLIISPDIDGLTSACLLASKFDCEIIGTYGTSHALLCDGASSEDAENALWLDHDISRPKIRCIGQHLVQHKSTDELPLRNKISWNPNIWQKQSWEKSFAGGKGTKRDKYPLGTAHFIADYVGIESAIEKNIIALFAHLDGTWFALDLYRQNAEIWIDLMFPKNEMIINILDYRKKIEFHNNHKDVIEKLVSNGVQNSQSRSPKAALLDPELKLLTGKQSIHGRSSQKPADFHEKTKSALKIIGEIVGMKPKIAKEVTKVISGKRHSFYPNRIENFDELMVEENIFSHAFTDLRTLSFTNQIEF
jgi:hypothetical protein